jgi:NAD(P)-dependent dehydrogenase (short-subunit alcohol dehydrogenase family)
LFLDVGGSAGIGKATAFAFDASGASVAILGRRKERLDAVVGLTYYRNQEILKHLSRRKFVLVASCTKSSQPEPQPVSIPSSVIIETLMMLHLEEVCPAS